MATTQQPVPDCLFCNMATGMMQVPKIFEDEKFFCIRDIQPQALHHLLIIPKKHVPSLAEAYPARGDQQVDLIGELFSLATQLARKEGLLPAGFRAVINTKQNAGQTVEHLHLHILGGEGLGHFGA